jgi:uncharacterized protein DUF4440
MSCAADLDATQRLDMESFASFDAETFCRLHHPAAVTILPVGSIHRGVDAIMAALADHFHRRVARYSWTEVHRYVDGCRMAFIVYETEYAIPASGFTLTALTGVTYVHEQGRWLVVADQGSLRDVTNDDRRQPS